MTGYHKVRVFNLRADAVDMELPPGWKPFGVLPFGANGAIVARKWCRLEKTKSGLPMDEWYLDGR